MSTQPQDRSQAPSPDVRAEIKDFLVTRRAKVTPQMVGLPVVGGHRRVPGLRREEVAMLAGVSVDYYTRLERGSMAGVSEQVLDALSATLLLDDAEHDHLVNLASSVSPTGRSRQRRSRPQSVQVRHGLQWILDAMPTPAVVRDQVGRYVATNVMARALYSPLFVDPVPAVRSQHPDLARFIFLDERARTFFPSWDQAAEDLVAMLRLAAGSDPHDADLQALIGELSTRSRDFSALWARHDVRYVCRGEKVIHHPVVGRMHLVYEPTMMATMPGYALLVYGVEPGSPSADAMRLLASWAATELDPAGHSEHSAGSDSQATSR